MTWRTEKTKIGEDFIWEGVETGIAASPVLGTANIQNANISTETSEVLGSFGRIAQTPHSITGGTLTPNGASLLTPSDTNLSAGQWIKVTASTITSITAATNPSSVTANYLIVGGGGGGGAATLNSGAGGGGGAGAMLTGTNAFSVGSSIITIGAGGAGNTNALGHGTNGGDSSIASVATATGGGGGGSGANPIVNATNGGSGGGGSGYADTSTVGTAGTGTTGGNNGGTGFATTNAGGGGGGGANAAGTNATNGTGGAGGAGTASSISGTSVTYAGGGGGGGTSGTAGAGGAGGGGAGGKSAVGSDATANTGGGGGGGGATASTKAGGAGGSGIVIISYTTGAMYAIGGVVTYSGGNTIHTFTESGVFTVFSIASGGLYYVSYKNGSNDIKLSVNFDPSASNTLAHGTTGTATFDVVAVPNQAIAKAQETYHTSTATYYRYYVLDANSYVWLYDTGVYAASLAASGVGTKWMLPDPTDYSGIGFTGMGQISGWLIMASNAYLWGKPTVDLGNVFRQLPGTQLNNPFANHQNYVYVGHQGKLYYCDDNYIGELFPTTSLNTSLANIQSYCSYTASSTTGTISANIAGSVPFTLNSSGTVARVPVVFFTDIDGTIPTALTELTVYYIQYSTALGTFNVYSASSGGSALDIATGAVGNQYFNTFFPLGLIASVNGTNPLATYSSQRVNLPEFETSTSLIEVGNTVLIGCQGNTVYPWNQIDATPSDFIALPEAGVTTMINVNNMAYVFAGNKGNVYITNGSVASLALKVPDYCAGVPGTQSSYIEPYFTWGDAAYMRGRIYFSILDQTATKAGNCGGVWSFVPTQNMYIGQDVGLALRLENQNSYGTYNGYANILIAAQDQDAIAPQYWSWWQDGISAPNYGIDFTNTVPVTTYVIETDLLKTGTMLQKASFSQLEYKLTSPLATGESVALYWRTNVTNAWTSAGTVNTETADPIAGYYNTNFQKTQWMQFRAVVTLTGDTTSSFGRLNQILLR